MDNNLGEFSGNMKIGEVLSIFIFVWLILSYIIVAIMDAVKGISFGLVNTSFGVVGEYALITVNNSIWALGLIGFLLIVSFLPSYKLKSGFVLIVLLVITVYFMYKGLLNYP